MKNESFIQNKKKWKFYLSGSMVEPYAHLWMEKIRKEGEYNRQYEAVNIFPYQKYTHKRTTKDPDDLRLKRVYKFAWRLDNAVPKWIQKIFSIHTDWQHWNWNMVDIDEQGNPFLAEKRPSLLYFAWKSYAIERKQRKCHHPNIEFDAHITPDTGSEYYFCPDCELQGRTIYY